MNRSVTVYIPFFVIVLLTFASGLSSQEYSSSLPRPIPLMRPQMKQLLEEMKQRKPRIPLPEVSADERETLGDRVSNYESRIRYHYLSLGASNEGRMSSVRREVDPQATLDNGFKVKLFWIVSRANNCHYCIGHQETKLLAAGIDENEIASLDCDWDSFTDRERVAFTFARKFTLEPHLLEKADIGRLQSYFRDEQILEMLLSIAWNNSINRWKEGIGVPQNPAEGGYSRALRGQQNEEPALDAKSLPSGSYLTPTASKFQFRRSLVAPLTQLVESSTDHHAIPVCKRPAFESREIVLRKLQQATNRTSAIPLLDEKTTRERLNLSSQEQVFHWMRLLARSTVEGVGRAKRMMEAEQHEAMSPLLRAQIAWIVARQDRAWYAVGTAERKLRFEMQTPEEIEALAGNWEAFSSHDRNLFHLAQNLAASPVVLTDEQVQRAVDAAGPSIVVQVINYVSQLAAFNRITEAISVPLESL